MDIILAKGRRAQRALRSYHLLLELQTRKMLPAVNEWMAMMTKQLRADLPKLNLKAITAAERKRKYADKKKIKRIVDSYTAWEKIKEGGLLIMRPALFEALEAGGNSVMGQRVRKQERFDVIGVEAVAWTTEHSAVLVVEVTTETMLAIRTYIEAGINAGKSIEAIAMELRPLVGLTARDIMAVANYHEMLILERPEYTVATQREMAEVYSRRLHRRRATTIARTETAEALTEGQRQGYKQMGIKKLMRVEDPDCCDICLEYDGHVYTIIEANGQLPEHPNCEGSWVAAL